MKKVDDALLAGIWTACIYGFMLVLMSRLTDNPLAATNTVFLSAYLFHTIYSWMQKK